MKFHLLPLAFCAALSGCATYYEPVPPYDPGYAYAYPYPYPYYPYPYAYPYYGAYGYSPLWISGTWFCCSGSRHHHRHASSWGSGGHR